jgi:hypothetical protein
MLFNTIDHVPENVGSLPICCVDLGFSQHNPTTGLAFSSEYGHSSCCVFDEAITRANAWLTACHDRQQTTCLLLIEAPLSVALTSSGAPCHRHIELCGAYEKSAAPQSPKGWFYQAGANLTLGSVFFIRGLKVPEGLSVYLIEGFYCSIEQGKKHDEDDFVAEHLRDLLLKRGGQPLVKPQGVEGAIFLAPGLESLVNGIPAILLREGLALKRNGNG